VTEGDWGESRKFHDVHAVHILDHTMRHGVHDVCVSTRGADASHPDHASAVLDTACGLSVAGSAWWESYQRLLASLALDSAVRSTPVSETFRFGDGREVTCAEAYEFPAVLCGKPLMLRSCVVPGDLSFLLAHVPDVR